MAADTRTTSLQQWWTDRDADTWLQMSATHMTCPSTAPPWHHGSQTPSSLSSSATEWGSIARTPLNGRVYSTTVLLLLLVWQAPLGVRSAKRRHQSPEWTILSHDDCFIQGEVIGFQVLLDSLHPRSTKASWRSPPVLQGAAVKISHV